MNKTLQVTIAFEFEGIEEGHSDTAEEIMQGLLIAMKRWKTEIGANSAWMGNPEIVSDGQEDAA